MLIRPLPLINFFVAVVMFSIGLRTSGREFLNILRDRALLRRSLVANCLLIPVVGFLLVHIFPLNPDATIGILLLAVIPGTPIALKFTRMAKTRLAFAAAMRFVLSLVSIALTPLAIEAMPQMRQRSAWPVLILIAHIALYMAYLCALVCGRRDAPRKLLPGWYSPWTFLPRLPSCFLCGRHT